MHKRVMPVRNQGVRRPALRRRRSEVRVSQWMSDATAISRIARITPEAQGLVGGPRVLADHY